MKSTLGAPRGLLLFKKIIITSYFSNFYNFYNFNRY